MGNAWKQRKRHTVAACSWLLAVVSIYVVSELIIWGLSRALAAIRLEYFASILGMISIFVFLMVSHICIDKTESCYMGWMKSKVDFLNANLGLGFTVPIVLLEPNELLCASDIARIIGNFITTNVVCWAMVFSVSAAILLGITRLEATDAVARFKLLFVQEREYPRAAAAWPHCNIERPAASWDARQEKTLDPPSSSHSSDIENTLSPMTVQPATEGGDATNTPLQTPKWKFLANCAAPLTWLLATLTIGVPVSAAANDDRLLDGCVLLFFWTCAGNAQRCFKRSFLLRDSVWLKNALGTAMNPVLATTLLTLAYTRVKAAALHEQSLSNVLHTFSSGVHLYELWTAQTLGHSLPQDSSGWYGAGDAALSLLECGILVWGFKLYECRQQIFSVAGAVTIIMCIVTAAASVFLSVISAKAMGLERTEALSFAVRSTTLALAKPSVEAVQGNVVVNAALVVGGGILGQLIYPYVLGRLGTETEDAFSTAQKERIDRSGSLSQRNSPRCWVEQRMSNWRRNYARQGNLGDQVGTVAAGIVVGINGSAMGVAYLYETRSRAAPYAALSTAVFGAMTVVFTTVNPFRDILIRLASG